MDVNAKYVPPFMVSLLAVTIIITLYLSYNEEHISGSLPYLSDTGALPPESCFFGQSMNLLWIIFSFAIYVKYRQTEHILNRHNVQKNVLNRRTFFVGLIAAFGVSIVGNFQETNMFYVHWFGAVLTFGLGSLYLCMQTVLYLSITPIIGQRKTTGLRIGLSVVAVITFLTFFITGMLSYAYKKEKGGYLHWTKDDGGYELHNTSVMTEWICASCVISFLSLCYWEFKKITVHAPDIYVDDKTTNTVDIVAISQ